MIKGVNKQVLEISQTNSNFFEKAIFFVKPEYMGMSEGKLKEQAQNQLDCVTSAPKIKLTGKSKVKSFLVFSAIFLSGVIFGLIFSSLG